MRWIAALALVLLLLVGLTVKVGTRRPKRAAVAASTDPEPSAVPSRTNPAPPRFSPSSERRERSGVARIKGIVHLPPGEEDADGLTDLEVTADDGTRTFDARMIPGGRFAFHLPPGRYTVTASVGSLVGSQPDVLARADAEREVDIQLGPGVAIRGTLRAPSGADVGVTAKPVGGSGEAGVADTGDATFEVTGLVPGRRYDLTFSGPRLRSASLRAITAPSEGLEIVIESLAIVRGAIGFPRGERCPISQVELKLPGSQKNDGDEKGLTDEIGADCRFELTVPEDVSVASVIATGPGWFLEQQVDIPPRGDPEALCLNPPCRDKPTEGLASLRISLEGATPDSVITADATSSNDSSSRYHSCSSEQGWCTLDELPVGETFKVDGYGDGCRAQGRIVVVVAGDNFVRLPCHRQRRVEGVVHIPNGAPPQHITVRCAGGGMRALRNTRLFELKCDAEDADLEYQIARGGPWLSVPLPRASDPAFVEISL